MKNIAYKITLIPTRILTVNIVLFSGMNLMKYATVSFTVAPFFTSSPNRDIREISNGCANPIAHFFAKSITISVSFSNLSKEAKTI